MTNKQHNVKIVSIPAFDKRGNLPPGIIWTDWVTLEKRFGQTSHRRRLLKGLRAALLELKAVGCRTVYIDGSFVTAKEKPGDFDGCWDPDGVDFDRLEGSVLLEFENKRAAQKAKFKGEMFLSDTQADTGGTLFLDFFQKDRDGNRKGIIALDLRSFDDD